MLVPALLLGEGGGRVKQGREQWCCPTEARRGRSKGTGGPPRRAHSEWRTSLRRAGTYWGVRGGIGKAPNRH